MRTRIIRLCVLAIVFPLVLSPAPVHADPVPVNRFGWMVNGYVTDSATSGNTLYVAGAFTAVAPAQNHVGGFVELSAGSAHPARLPAEVSGGDVVAVTDDGAGGWFIGGHFTSVGGVTQRYLARLRPDGTLDTSFAPIVNTAVYALLRRGTTLYVAGAFTTVDAQTRGSGAAFDTTTGALLPWNPLVTGPSRDVVALAAVGDRVAIGGLFSAVGGVGRSSLALVDATTGAVLPTTVNVLGGSGYVTALAARGTNIYVGGSFSFIGASFTARQNLAAVDALTGTVLPFTANTNGIVQALLATDSGVYVGGQMTTIQWGAGASGLAGRRYLALVDAATGAATAWNPNPNNHVYSLALSGQTLVFGGLFTSVGGQGRAHVAAVDATGAGALLPWNAGLSGGTYALAAGPAGTIAAGGAFTHYGATTRTRVAAIDTVTGALQPLSVEPSSVVRDLEVVGATLYMAGQFSLVNGLSRLGFAAVDVHSGAVLPWNPQANLFGNTLAVAGNTVFLGGSFSSVGGQPRVGLAQVDATTGAVTPFVMNASGFTALQLPTVLHLRREGTRLLVGGNFTTLGGLPRTNVAVIDLTTGLLTGTTIAVGGSGSRVDVLEPFGDVLYLAGTFGSVGGQPRGNAAAVSLVTGAVLPFAPAVNQPVFDLAVTADTVYLAGNFTAVNGQARRTVAAVDAATGQTTRAFAVSGGGTVQGSAGGHVSIGADGLWVGAGGFTPPGTSFLQFFPEAGMGGLPGPPTVPTVQLTGATLTLQWAPPTLGGAPLDYIVEAGSGPGRSDIATLPLGSSTPRFTYAPVPAGTYYMRVRARSAAGVGPASGEVAFTAGIPGCAGPPQATLAAVGVSGDLVNLSWTDAVSGAAGVAYTLEAGSAPGRADIATVPLGAARAFTASAPPGVYFTRLRTTSPCGVATVSPDVVVEVGGARRLMPPTVTAQVGGNAVTITWDAVPGATDYVLVAGSGPTLADVATVVVAGTTLQAAAPAGTYYVRVYARGGSPISAASRELVLRVP